MAQHSSELLEIIHNDLDGVYDVNSITLAIQGLERVLILMAKEDYEEAGE